VRVLIIQGGFDSNLVTGEEVVIANDASYLERNQVEVIYEKIKTPSVGWSSVVKKVGGLTWSFSNYYKIKRLIKRYNPDLIHFHSVVPYLSFSVVVAA